MAATKVNVEILVDVDCRVVDWVHQLVEIVRRRFVTLGCLRKGVAAGIPIARCEDELLGPSSTNAVDSGLVVLEEQRRGHVMRLTQCQRR